MLSGGKTARQVVEEQGLTQISDEGELRRMVEEVLAANPEAVKDFRDGKERAVGFLVGQVMKASRGKANPPIIDRMLRELLGS